MQRLYDGDIREALFDFLEEHYGKCRMIEEKMMGRSRADIVMVVDGGLYGIEIKSDHDSYTRLSRQVADYERYFDYNYLVVGSSHASHAAEHIPAHWGILSVEAVMQTAEGFVSGEANIAQSEQRGEILQPALDFYVLREPKRNPNREMGRKLSLLWRPELAYIQASENMPAYREYGKKRLIEKILPRLTEAQWDCWVSERLFERDYTKIEEEITAYKRERMKEAKKTTGRPKGRKGGRRKKKPNLLVSKVVKAKKR